MKLKRIFTHASLLVSMIIFLISLMACDFFDLTDVESIKEEVEEILKNPVKIDIDTPKSLFLGKSNSTHKLFEILEDGAVIAVPFLDEDGNEVEVNVSRIFKISDNYIAIKTASTWGSLKFIRLSAYLNYNSARS